MDQAGGPQTGQTPPPRVGADPGRFLHCPIQTSENDIPILRFDMHGGAKQFKRKLKVLKQREIVLSPFIIEMPNCWIHATPLSIPVPIENSKEMKNLSSYHIIQIFSSKMKPQKQVDLLISDEDLYFAAFRRHVIELSEQEMRRGTRLGPGKWYAFDDEIKTLPEFINAQAIGMDGGYKDKNFMTPGGSDEFMGEILRRLYNFEALPVLSTGFKRATHCIMLILCETRRSRGMQLEIQNRMERRLDAFALKDLFYLTVHMWSKYSGVVLSAKKEGTLSLSLAINDTYRVGLLAKFEGLNCLIGMGGELLILKFNASYLTMTSFELEVEIRRARNPGYAPNPSFVDQ